MRYIITFFDRTTRRVDEKAAAAFATAMETKSTVEYKHARYAGSSIVSIKPLYVHESDLREEAVDSGLFRCAYGRNHTDRSECVCRDAKFEKKLTADEETKLLELKDNNYISEQERIRVADSKFLGITARKDSENTGSWTKDSDIR